MLKFLQQAEEEAEKRFEEKESEREKCASGFCHCLEPRNHVKRNWETGMASVAGLPNPS